MRLGFVGLGWIGLNRMEALRGSGVAEVAAIAEPSPEALERARAAAPEAAVADGLAALLDLDLDGVVIATPSALHASQSRAVLERGLPVFCQKPLGRTGDETASVVELARRQDVRIGVDLSYRHTTALRAVHDLVASGEIGTPYAADLVFHNAYGPDKAWFYDRSRSGGGCVVDLGIHLVDAALWVLGFPEVERVESRLFAGGRRMAPGAVEDFATATLDLATGASVRVACSWNLPAGRDAVIEASFFGTDGGVALRNVDGSFYDFVAERFRGTAVEPLCGPPDAWGGRALVAWAEALARDPTFDSEAEQLVTVARVLDEIYG